MRQQDSPRIIVSQLLVPVWGSPSLSGVVEDRSVGHPVRLVGYSEAGSKRRGRRSGDEERYRNVALSTIVGSDPGRSLALACV